MGNKDSPLIFNCYIRVEGEKIEFNHSEANLDLADRCKLALAEMTTGHKCTLENGDS